MKYIIHLLHSGTQAEVNFDRDIPSIEYQYFQSTHSLTEHFDFLLNRPSPRLYHTHLPRHFLPGINEVRPKVIVVTRNPKDTLVSFYHHQRRSKTYGPFTGTWDEFVELHQPGLLRWGGLFENNMEWWGLRGQSNVLYVIYEQMKRDLEEVIWRVAKFCIRDPTEAEVYAIADLCSFEKMRNNPNTNHSGEANTGHFNFGVSPFMRKGVVGDWKEYFSPEQSRYVDAQCEEYRAMGLIYEYE